MTVEMMQTLSLVLYILAGVLAVTAIILFIALRVPRIIGELTGSAERKAIENIRKQNLDAANTDAENKRSMAADRHMTDKISRSGRLAQRETRMSGVNATQKLGRQTVMSGAETELLNPGMGETEMLRPVVGETEVLGPTAGETTLLNPAILPTETSEDLPVHREPEQPQSAHKDFSIDHEIQFSGSSEWIE